MGLANKITIGRLILTAIYLVVLYNLTLNPILNNLFFWIAVFILFLIIAILDAVDGYIARLYGEVSSFGRMLDPFVDKIFIISSYIIFGSYELTSEILPIWMVILILFREILIQGVRHYIEGLGREFGSNIFGKQKMLFQSIVLGGLILYMLYFKLYLIYKVLLKTAVYLMFITTILSGMIYIYNVVRDLSKKEIIKQ